ncbi:MAG: glycosyltransferase family 1 protein [Ferruginibacter sp.]|nr:glycosyltransferase family 1 protein [Ferruginibacter sp.]
MKIAITTVGTRGDLQPFIALGLGLQQAGYEVVLISSKNEESFVKSYGLDFFALNVDIQKLMEGDDVKEMSKGSNPLKFFISHLKGSKKLKQLMVATQQEIWNGCISADIIIYHPGMPIGFFIAKELGKISIAANPFPIISTKDYPSILFYTGPRLGRIYNLITHFIFEKLFWTLSKPALKQFWNKTIQSKMNFSVAPLRQQINSGMPVINGYSKLLFHQPKEWPNNIHTTGSWLIEKEPYYTAPPDLVDFIAAGKTPVYIGFGSMKDIDSFKATFAIIVEALQITRQKAVLALGWNNLNYHEPVPKNIFLIESVAHSWLFPKMAVVIHHGGAGTTAAGLTAGKPTIIIPHNADQPAWGKRVFELGVGSKPIKKSNLSAVKLATAILYALTPSVIEKAAELGQQLRKENGVGTAVAIINEYVKNQ